MAVDDRWHRDPQSAPQPSRRKPRRARVWLAAVLGVGVIAAAAFAVAGRGTARADYRDPVTLARAVRGQAQSHAGGRAVSADCAPVTGTTYVCSVGFSDLTVGTWRVTVSPDGSAYTMAAP